ncbi:hypothetical protein ACFX15_021013 [Malus domestica]
MAQRSWSARAETATRHQMLLPKACAAQALIEAQRDHFSSAHSAAQQSTQLQPHLFLDFLSLPEAPKPSPSQNG